MISKGDQTFLQKANIGDAGDELSSDDETLFSGSKPWTKEDWSRKTTAESTTSGGTSIAAKEVSDFEDNTTSVHSEDESAKEGYATYNRLNFETLLERDDESVSSDIVDPSTAVPVRMVAKWQVTIPDLPLWTAPCVSASVVCKLQAGAVFTGIQKGNWVRLQGKPWCCMISDGERVFLEKVPGSELDEIAHKEQITHSWNIGCVEGLTKL